MFFTFDLIFRNFKDWIHFSLQTGCPYGFPKFSKSNLGITHTESLFAGLTFRSDILDGSLSQDSASPLNGVRDLNCRSKLSSLPLIIGTFVTESTALLCCTEPGTAFIL